jgi:hypothetical protein
MNAFNTVNLAGACLLTSVEYAREIGIPESRWIYPLGAAGTRDSYDCEFMCPSNCSLAHIYSLGAPKFPLKPMYITIARCWDSSVRAYEG